MERYHGAYTLFHRFADWFDAHRRTVAIGLIIAVVASLVGVVRLEYDDVPRGTFRSDDAEFQRLEQTFQDFGADDVDAVLLVEADDVYRPAAVAALRRLIHETSRTAGVVEVRSLADPVIFPRRYGAQTLTRILKPIPTSPVPILPELPADGSLPSERACAAAREAALAHPLAQGQLISDDARATLVVARIDEQNQAIRQLAPIVEHLQQIADRATATGPLTVRLTGMAPIRTEIFESVRAESTRFVLVGGALTLVMAMILFRRPAAVAIVCSAAMLGAIWTIGLMGLAGERMNIITTVLPTLVMIVGFTDAVHLMIDIRRERAAGMPPRAAAHDALRHLGFACLLCAVTMAIGFGSLGLAKIEIIRRFGLLCAMGAVLAVFGALVLVPLLAGTRLGRHVRSEAEFDLPERIAKLFEPVVRFLVDHARTSASVGIAVTAALCFSTVFLRPSNSATEALPTARPSFQAVAELDKHFGGSMSAMILVEWDEPLAFDSAEVLGALEAVQQIAAEHEDVRSPSSLVNLVRSLPGADQPLVKQAEQLRWVDAEQMRHYVRPELRRALVHLRLRDVGSDVHLQTFDDLRTGFVRLQSRFPGVHFHLTGTSVLASRNLDQMIRDLNSSLGSAAAIIFLIMAVGFRSFRLGLISIVPNLFPMAFTAAFLVATGRPLQMTSVMVFSICLGIAVDDTIHFVNRFQRELAVDGDVRAAVLRTYRAVGAAMIMTSLVLLAGFGSLQISEMPTTQLFSMLACVTILAAVVGDLLILPPLLCVFAKPRPTAVPVVDKADGGVNGIQPVLVGSR
jgi:predicted RND superfamily exporter protein